MEEPFLSEQEYPFGRVYVSNNVHDYGRTKGQTYYIVEIRPNERYEVVPDNDATKGRNTDIIIRERIERETQD